MSWLHMQNWLYIFNKKPGDFLLLNHFWSLSIEEQFYIVWPFVILSIKSTRRLAHIAYIMLGLCIVARFSSWLYFGQRVHYFLFSIHDPCGWPLHRQPDRYLAFSSYAQAKKKLFTLASILLGIHLCVLVLAKTIFTGLPHFQFFGYSTVAVALGIVIYFAVEKRNSYSKALMENAPLRYMGKISYGLYVYHWPVLVLLKLYFLDKLVSYGYSYDSSYIFLSLAGLVIAVILSIASYHLFEKKILALKDILTEDGFFTRAGRKLLLFLKPVSSR